MRYFDSLNGMAWGQKLRHKKFWVLVALCAGILFPLTVVRAWADNGRSAKTFFDITPQDVVNGYNDQLDRLRPIVIARNINVQWDDLRLARADKMARMEMGPGHYALYKRVKPQPDGSELAMIMIVVEEQTGKAGLVSVNWIGGVTDKKSRPTELVGIVMAAIGGADLMWLCEQAFFQQEAKFGPTRDNKAQLFCTKGDEGWSAGVNW